MSLKVCTLYPDLLGTYGDGGNAIILDRRATWRGFEVERLEVRAGDAIPVADLYCIGGGEDGPQVRATALLKEDGTLEGAVRDGAVLLAVCAGFQIIGRRFTAAEGRDMEGLGLLDVETVRSDEPRAVGEVTATIVASTLGHIPPLSGFENHGGRTQLGAGVEPLAKATKGVGNGFDGTEGAVAGRILATYLHGPVLARNPAIADVLLSWALNISQLEPLDDSLHDALRNERGL